MDHSETIEIIQGDCYWDDFETYDLTELDTGWTGSWVISSELGGTALASGILTLSTDKTKLERRITPTDTETIAPGKYWLVAQIVNTAIGYKKEKQEEIYILPQGI